MKPVTFDQIVKVGFRIAVLIAVIALAVWAKKAGFFEALLNAIDALGVWAAPAFVAAYVMSCLLLFPSVVMTCGAGIIFPLPLAIFLSLLGTALGAGAALLIGRYGLRNWVQNAVAKNQKFQQLDGAIQKEGWKIAALARLTPIFPFSIGNYLFGATKIPVAVYAATAFVGTIPSASVYAYLGRMTKKLGEAGSQSRSPGEWGLLGIGIIATIVLSWYLKRFFDKIFARSSNTAIH